MEENVILTMRGICKEFPGVRALHNVDFTLRKGEIHALMGENGAGKSTLVKVLTGVHIKDSGEIRISGHEGEAQIHSPQDAQNLGISTVYQEITLCPNLTVAENLFIGRGSYHFINWKAQEKKATDLLEKLNIPARATQQLGSCSIAVQQMVAIARAVDMDCKVLILDEPTSSLDEREVELLFTLMRELKARGVGIIFITHFLDQVYEVCDRITVLRNGELVGEYAIKDMPRVDLISAMLGKDLEDISKLKDSKKTVNANGTPVYEAEGLSSAEGVKPFKFKIQKGEVNGFTGLLGSGRSESVRAIFAADRVTGGKIKMNGKDVKILPAGRPQGRRHHTGFVRARKPYPCAAVAQGLYQTDFPRGIRKACRRIHQAAGNKNRFQGNAHQVAFRRKPAESYPCALAAYAPAVPYP